MRSMHEVKSTAQFILQFSMIGFFMHLIWELVQCSMFFRHQSLPPTLLSMLLATIGDVATMWLVFLIVSALSSSFTWFALEWNLKKCLLILLPSIALSFITELWAQNTGRWSYTDSNPVIPVIGVSILPLVQMAFINSTVMFVSKFNLTSLVKTKAQQKESL